jgi:hypothetical protein
VLASDATNAECCRLGAQRLRRQMRTVVLIYGVLRGMGHETGCQMVAIRDTQPEPRASVYTRCSVLDAPSELPDGGYRVYFEGRSVAVRKQGGLWLAEEPPVSGAA